ncbi:hypothetical protein IL306_006378 [Fusarium sp. DS 682]|nr:hypothetical protein IL306_006378 [Fusarium sp. DS 682]
MRRLRRAQNKAETSGPNGDTVRRNDPTMNPITRRPGPGRGRPRKQPPVPVAGVPGETPLNQPIPVGVVPGPQNNSMPYPHPHPQVAPAYGVPPGNHQPGAPLPAQAAVQPANISPTPPAQQVPPPNNTPQVQGPVTYPSPQGAPDTPQTPAHLHPLQPGQSVQSGQQPQPAFQPQPDQQAQPEQPSQPTMQPQAEQGNSSEYQSQDISREASREAREAIDANVVSQHAPAEQNPEPQATLTSEQLQHANEDIDADGDAEGDADGEADINNDEPAAKRPRLGSPEPPKDTDMDDEAVLALAAHNGSTDFASE